MDELTKIITEYSQLTGRPLATLTVDEFLKFKSFLPVAEPEAPIDRATLYPKEKILQSQNDEVHDICKKETTKIDENTQKEQRDDAKTEFYIHKDTPKESGNNKTVTISKRENTTGSSSAFSLMRSIKG